MTQAKDIQLQTFGSPPGLKKIQALNKPMLWGINRLKRLPPLFSNGASAMSSSLIEEEVHVTSFPIKEKWFPEDSDKWTEKKRAVKVASWKRLRELEKITVSYPEDKEWAMISKYDNISQNEFFLREHVVQKEVDISVCECSPETECRLRCLNALLSYECTPNNCPCGALCQNQKFQKCENARVRKKKTNDRGWGLYADQDIKVSDFVIEYCGEVVSDTVALSRLRAYEMAGLKESYMMFLDGTECLDATRKGNLARFINHSCEPNCKTMKWHVLGELRIGIFAVKDIKSGEELTYDYRFQLHESIKIKCLCGSPSCVGLLGIKSQASQVFISKPFCVFLACCLASRLALVELNSK
ncbi:hypothetical protein M758_UG182800 [Ceratodon purpureus]|nr:hypothetical protein M758_UG182800 [Ceratodon purpureus]